MTGFVLLDGCLAVVVVAVAVAVEVDCKSRVSVAVDLVVTSVKLFEKEADESDALVELVSGIITFSVGYDDALKMVKPTVKFTDNIAVALLTVVLPLRVSTGSNS